MEETSKETYFNTEQASDILTYIHFIAEDEMALIL